MRHPSCRPSVSPIVLGSNRYSPRTYFFSRAAEVTVVFDLVTALSSDRSSEGTLAPDEVGRTRRNRCLCAISQHSTWPRASDSISLTCDKGSLSFATGSSWFDKVPDNERSSLPGFGSPPDVDGLLPETPAVSLGFFSLSSSSFCLPSLGDALLLPAA